MNFKKMLIGVMIGLMLIILGGCNMGGNVEVPNGLKIIDSVVSWDDNDSNLTYRLQFTDVNTQVVTKRVVVCNTDLNTLYLPAGTYDVCVQAISGDKESEFSAEITYQQVDIYAIRELKEDQLVNDQYVKWMGRTYYDEIAKVNRIYYSASGFEVHFSGTTVSATIKATNASDAAHCPYVVIVVDGDFSNSQRVALTKAETTLVLASDLVAGSHAIAVYKSTESIDSHIALSKLTTDGSFQATVNNKDRKLEVIGDSVSTGYGNLGNKSVVKTTANSNALQAYAFLTAQALNADINIVANSGWGCRFSPWTADEQNMFNAYKKVDANSTIDWTPSKYIPDVVVICLGANDSYYLDTQTSVAAKASAKQAFITQYLALLTYIQECYPKTEIVMLYGQMGEVGIYSAIEDVYAQASSTINHLSIIKINGDGAGCDSHPSATSGQLTADTLAAKIKEIMDW